MKNSDRYFKIVEWSEENQWYISIKTNQRCNHDHQNEDSRLQKSCLP